MNLRRYYIFIAVIGLVGATLACGSFTSAPAATSVPVVASGPTASDFYMSTDAEGKNQTTIFASTETFYCNLTVNGVKGDTKLEARWYGLDISGQDPTTPFKTATYTGTDLKIPTDTSTGIYFNLIPPSTGWPTGSYKVEVYLDGTKAGEQQFSVK
jgi:hypothetical protein